MKNVLVFGLVGTLLFATSASISLYLNRKVGDGEAPVKEAKTKEGAKASKSREESVSEDDRRPVIRTSVTPETENVAVLAKSLEERRRALKEREEVLSARQKQLELVYQDIRSERADLDELRKKIAEELKEVSKKLSSVEGRFGELEQQRSAVNKNLTDLEKRQTELQGTERKNINRMADTFNSMQADQAARILQQMADSGSLDTAVKLLGEMKERQAAKVLAEFSDASLAAQLLDKLRGLKRGPTTSQESDR
ncbi:MAG TPA: hypothetical protein VFA18_03050 [Gemmataceae bacterium]|jgi:flagellar motility protein MotE (MotC chaperone)|nr:hypothetical protein [Gemmataceae bacterium]